jgi:hypothetical protein
VRGGADGSCAEGQRHAAGALRLEAPLVGPGTNRMVSTQAVPLVARERGWRAALRAWQASGEHPEAGQPDEPGAGRGLDAAPLRGLVGLDAGQAAQLVEGGSQGVLA